MSGATNKINIQSRRFDKVRSGLLIMEIIVVIISTNKQLKLQVA